MARMKTSHALTLVAVAVALLSTARLDAATASAPMTVSVRVIARAVITIENEGDVVVTHDDIERGYVELTSPIVLNVRTNSRRGYVLEVSKSNEAFSSVELSMPDASVRVGDHESLLQRPYVQGGDVVPVRAHLVLAPGIVPGTHRLPVTFKVTAL